MWIYPLNVLFSHFFFAFAYRAINMGNSGCKAKNSKVKQDVHDAGSGSEGSDDDEARASSAATSGERSPPPSCKLLPRGFIMQTFTASDLEAMTHRSLTLEKLVHSAVTRDLFSDSPYLQGGNMKADELCRTVQQRLLKMAQQHAGAGEEVVVLVWNLLGADAETQWRALVYLFHDAAQEDMSGGRRCYVDSSILSRLLSFLANVAVENACSVEEGGSGRCAAQGGHYAASAAELPHESIAQWLADKEVAGGAGGTGRALAQWAEAHAGMWCTPLSQASFGVL